MPLLKPEQQYSYVDYLTWPEEERWEILDGIPYMQATPTDKHQMISGELYRQFSTHLHGKSCRIFHPPFSVILDEESNNSNIRNVLEPDLTIVCDRSKLTGRGYKGGPSLIVEILSPSSVKRDKIIKLDKYEKIGVKEYWIVDPESNLVDVFILQADGRYGRSEIYSSEDTIKVSIFSDLEIDLNSVFEVEF